VIISFMAGNRGSRTHTGGLWFGRFLRAWTSQSLSLRYSKHYNFFNNTIYTTNQKFGASKIFYFIQQGQFKTDSKDFYIVTKKPISNKCCSFESENPEISLTVYIKILSCTTVFNIDNN